MAKLLKRLESRHKGLWGESAGKAYRETYGKMSPSISDQPLAHSLHIFPALPGLHSNSLPPIQFLQSNSCLSVLTPTYEWCAPAVVKNCPKVSAIRHAPNSLSMFISLNGALKWIPRNDESPLCTKGTPTQMSSDAACCIEQSSRSYQHVMSTNSDPMRQMNHHMICRST